MSQIRHLSTSTVRPTSHNGQLAQRIELTPWEFRPIKLEYNQNGLLFHKSADEQVNKSLIQHLKSSLSRTLNIFYPLAGRLAVTENENNTLCIFIDCNDAGVQFVHAAADSVTLADILDSVYIPEDIVFNLIPMNEARNCDGISKPLLAVQVTELADGIFIGCSINHSVADGTSYWHFFNTWSEISRSGSDHKISQTPPVFDRHFFDGVIDLPLQIPFSYSEIFAGNPYINEASSDTSRIQVFHFPTEKVAQLKEKANAEMGTNNISSLQALMAHLWRATVRSAHDFNPDQEVIYFLMTDVRKRLKPPFPEEYLGNPVQLIVVKSTAGELLQNGLGWAAFHIHKMIASYTSDHVKKYLEDFVKTPNYISGMKNIKPATSAALFTGGSQRFNVYGNDFGWGRPLAVRNGASTKKDGRLIVYPGADEGSIEFQACLPTETLNAMAKDAEFMEALLT
ncbi:hypothetical protein M0R45_027068 [Rubus argutus]|uniref:Shikimate O-hydroxycinnamoyltransferase n=1 Tax=Rubus argutus TaxID=59490 RepID=A0AAW1WZC4_RUBAR